MSATPDRAQDGSGEAGTAAALERRLAALSHALCLEKDQHKYGKLWAEFARLHAQRSPQTVMRMEREQELSRK